MEIPQVASDFVQTPAGARGLEITKTANPDAPFFYNFPFAAGADCGARTCPGAEAVEPIRTNSNGSPFGRAAFMENGESITFAFDRNGGAFGISFALRATDVSATPSIEFDFGGIASATYTEAEVEGEMAKLWFEPTTATPHSSTFSTVTITFTGLPMPVLPNPGANGGWFVFNEIYFGDSGYNCVNQPANTAALSINLLGLPEETAVSYDGNQRAGSSIVRGTQISNVGDQVVVLCVPPGNPVVSVYDNSYIFRSDVDSNVAIDCGSGHFASLESRCFLDPRANLAIETPCVPVMPNGDRVSASLFQVGAAGPFRTNLTVSSTELSFVVLASKTVFVKYVAMATSTAGGSYYSCLKSNAVQAPASCVVTTPRGPLAKKMQFRIKCSGDANPELPSKIDVNVTFVQNATYKWEWLLRDSENTDQELCVPSFGTYTYNAQEFGTANVTTDNAQTSCSTGSLSSRCNTTPLDLVTVIQGPGICVPTPDCNGKYESEVWAGGNGTGFPLCLSYNGVNFREFYQQPFEQIRQCVMNLNVVEIKAHIETSDETVSTTLSAAYDCTRTEGETPGHCTAYPGNPVNFFQLLQVNSGNLKNLDWRVQYTKTSTEGEELVCSNGILANSEVCGAQGVENVCVPAIGSAPVTPECGASYLPERIEVVAQQCPSNDACFANIGESSCRPPNEQCISLTAALDCRLGCATVLSQELCLWDLLALPKAITVDLLPADSQHTAAVCTWEEQGRRPKTYEVLATQQRVQLTEATTSVSGLVDCSTAAGCKWNDYLAYVNLQTPLAFEGEQVIDDVRVAISGTTRSRIRAGKNAGICHPVAVLAANYTFVYSWAGASRTIEDVSCTGCPATCTGIPDCIVRFFAVDATTPSQDEYHIVLDALGQPIEQDEQYQFKSFGNPWASLPVKVSVNGQNVDDCSVAYDGTVCQPEINQSPLRVYYALAPDANSPYTVTVQLGCDSEDYSLICPTDVNRTGLTSCGESCPSPAVASTYNKACYFNTSSSAMVGPAQSASTCSFDECHVGWNAVRILTNNVIDLRKLPDGSSNISSVVPPHGNGNNYRGAPYRGFDGVLTTRINPFDAQICCGSDCSEVPPLELDCFEEPEFSTCHNPIVFSEVGGFQVVFSGLYHQTNHSYRITVQELFRDETRRQYEEMRPDYTPGRCTDEAETNIEWNSRIKLIRPTSCSVTAPATSQCGPSAPGKVCAFLYSDKDFIASWTKGAAENEEGVGQLKFTYSIAFLSELYVGGFGSLGGKRAERLLFDPIFETTSVDWNVTRPHSLLRPNKWAAPADKFYMIKDLFYRTRLNVDQTPVIGPPVQCVETFDFPVGETPPTEDYCTSILPLQWVIPFQALASKK